MLTPPIEKQTVTSLKSNLERALVKYWLGFASCRLQLCLVDLSVGVSLFSAFSSVVAFYNGLHLLQKKKPEFEDIHMIAMNYSSSLRLFSYIRPEEKWAPMQSISISFF